MEKKSTLAADTAAIDPATGKIDALFAPINENAAAAKKAAATAAEVRETEARVRRQTEDARKAERRQANELVRALKRQNETRRMAGRLCVSAVLAFLLLYVGSRDLISQPAAACGVTLLTSWASYTVGSWRKAMECWR